VYIYEAEACGCVWVSLRVCILYINEAEVFVEVGVWGCVGVSGCVFVCIAVYAAEAVVKARVCMCLSLFLRVYICIYTKLRPSRR